MRNLLKHALILSLLVTTSIIADESRNFKENWSSHPETPGINSTAPAEDFTPSYDYYSFAQGKANIVFELKKPGYANIRIYDAAGKTVDELLTSTFGAGSHEIVWDPSKFPSGKYYYSLITSEYSITKQLN